MKKWDYKAAQRPDIFIANSQTTQARIAQFYNRESHVVYPFYKPVYSSQFPVLSGDNISNSTVNSKLKTENYFVCLGRVVPYKRFDLAIEACNHLRYNLKIFTNTRNAESERLQKLSGPTIQWIFRATDEEVGDELAGADGFIMPQEEDF